MTTHLVRVACKSFALSRLLPRNSLRFAVARFLDREALNSVDASAARTTVAIIARLSASHGRRHAIIASVSQTHPTLKPRILASFLILAGAIGLWASWELTLAKFETLISPGTGLGCDFSVLVQCGKNLDSWQGSVFGFPNPLLGLAGFVAPIAVGLGVFAGARFTRWFWVLFNLGVVGALAFVCWLIYQSIFVLGTLCPWCMVVWSVTIPLFWAVSLYNLSVGNIPVSSRARKFFKASYGWVPLLVVLSYLVVGVLAQLRLDVINNLF